LGIARELATANERTEYPKAPRGKSPRGLFIWSYVKMSSNAETVRNKKIPVVAIAGATGAVGVELMQCLEQRQFPLAELRLLASARSVGKSMKFRGRDLKVQELTDES